MQLPTKQLTFHKVWFYIFVIIIAGNALPLLPLFVLAFCFEKSSEVVTATRQSESEPQHDDSVSPKEQRSSF